MAARGWLSLVLAHFNSAPENEDGIIDYISRLTLSSPIISDGILLLDDWDALGAHERYLTIRADAGGAFALYFIYPRLI